MRRKDVKWNPGWDSLQSGGERALFKRAGLPVKLLRKPQETYARAVALLEKIKLIEVQLTEWEDKQPIDYLEKLPWWEERKKYREQKAAGTVEEVTWWQALHHLEEAMPSRMGHAAMWFKNRGSPNAERLRVGQSKKK